MDTKFTEQDLANISFALGFQLVEVHRDKVFAAECKNIEHELFCARRIEELRHAQYEVDRLRYELGVRNERKRNY